MGLVRYLIPVYEVGDTAVLTLKLSCWAVQIHDAELGTATLGAFRVGEDTVLHCRGLGPSQCIRRTANRSPTISVIQKPGGTMIAP